MRNLFLIFAIQCIAFIALLRLFGRTFPSLSKIFAVAALGALFGFAYDSVLGAYGRVFEYPDVSCVGLFLALNAVLSYGVAACTAWILPCTTNSHRSSMARVVAGAALLVLALGVLGALASQQAIQLSPLVRAFSIGILIVSAVELAAVVFWRLGPILRMTWGEFGPFACLVVWSAVVGAIYEAANLLCPLWQWNLGPNMPFWTEEAIIVALGYFVLFHPLLVVSRTICGEPSQSPLKSE
jgi:hypothetical protein